MALCGAVTPAAATPVVDEVPVEGNAARPPRWKLVSAFLAIYLIWGSTYLAIAVAIETLPGFLMAGARFLAAGLIALAWARLRGAPTPTAAEWGSATVVGALMLVGGNGTVVWAERFVPSGLAALLVATMLETGRLWKPESRRTQG